MKMERVQFYVIVDKNNLEFVKDEYDTTKSIDRAMMFENKNEAFEDLNNYDDGLRLIYDVYEVTRETTTSFKLLKEE